MINYLLGNWQSLYQKIIISKGEEANIFMKASTTEPNKMYLVSCGHPTDGILLLGYFNANKLAVINQSFHFEIIQGSTNSPLKIRSKTYGGTIFYFVPLGIFTNLLDIKINKF